MTMRSSGFWREEGEDRRPLVEVQQLFLLQRRAPADVETARRQPVVGKDGRDPIAGPVDRAGQFDVVLDAFDADPDAGEAGERPAVETVVEDLLHAGRIEDRHHRVDEGELRLVRGGRAFAGVVVAHQRDDAAMLRRAGEIGVAKRVAGAVDARPLAVPEAEDAVVAALAAHLRLLRAPDGRGGEILVEAGPEDDVRCRRSCCLGAPEIAGRGRRAASRDSR